MTIRYEDYRWLMSKVADDDEKKGKKDVPEGSVQNFLKSKKSVPDKKFHSWAERKGYHVPSAESKAYGLASKMSRLLSGGKSKGNMPKGVDPKEAKQGLKVEKEHTKDSDVAKKITKDHFAETPRGYYLGLSKLEKSLKKTGSLRGKFLRELGI